MKRRILHFVFALSAVAMCVVVNAQTTVFKYTATEKLDQFDNVENFVGAISLASHTFEGMSGVVTYNGDVTEIGADAFMWASALRTIEVPEGVTDIRIRAFQYCQNMTSILLPTTLSHVENLAFEGCKDLINGKLIIKDIEAWCAITFDTMWGNPLMYAKHIYADADTEITSLVIPDGITTIGKYAFYKCEGITSIKLPYGLTEIGAGAFEYCTNISEVNIPTTVETIGESAFARTESLESVILPQGVSTIGSMAFAYSGLTSITIPSSVTEWGGGAFGYMQALETATVEEGVTFFDGFCGCPVLKTVTIPSTVTRIDGFAFRGSKAIDDIYCYANSGNMEYADLWSGLKEDKGTLFHVQDAQAWSEKYPDANVTFVGDIPTKATESVANGVQSGVLYDLMGHSVKGEPLRNVIYIKDGKKVLFR